MTDCGHCNSGSAQMVCSGCHGVFYCDKLHQKEHWKLHKPMCQKIAEANKLGFVKETLQAGEAGKQPKANSEITVDYTGRFANGKVFDIASPEGFKFKAGAGQVIQGWDQALLQMMLNEKARLYISAPLAYGKRGHPPAIPPNMPLIFDVHLVKI